MRDRPRGIVGRVRDRQLESLLAELPEFRARTGEELPTGGVRMVSLGVLTQTIDRIVLRIHRETDEPNSIAVGPTPGALLKFLKSRRLAGTRGRATGEHEIGDPDMTLQILAAVGGARLIGQSEFRRSEQDGWRIRI